MFSSFFLLRRTPRSGHATPGGASVAAVRCSRVGETVSSEYNGECSGKPRTVRVVGAIDRPNRTGNDRVTENEADTRHLDASVAASNHSIDSHFLLWNYGTFPARFGRWGIQPTRTMCGFSEHSRTSSPDTCFNHSPTPHVEWLNRYCGCDTGPQFGNDVQF